MIEHLYAVLEKIGCAHPIHPPLTHIPMGLVFGAFISALIALLFRRTILPVSAYNRILLAEVIPVHHPGARKVKNQVETEKGWHL